MFVTGLFTRGAEEVQDKVQHMVSEVELVPDISPREPWLKSEPVEIEVLGRPIGETH